MINLNKIKNQLEDWVKRSDSKKIIEECSLCYGIGEAFRKGGYSRNHMLDKENLYYAYLMAYSSLFNPDHPLEIGAQTGAGIASIMYGHGEEKCIGVTCDVNILEISDEVSNAYLDGKNYIKIIHLKDRLDCVNLDFNKYDFIFIDIGHDGDVEYQIHQKLLEIKWKGIVFWDDIKLDHRMIDFWNKITNQKIETDWHGKCGFGIVAYG